MEQQSSTMPEQVALFERNVKDSTWTGRLTVDDPVAELGPAFVCNGLITPTRVTVTSLLSPEAVDGAGERLAAVTLEGADGLLVSSRSGNPSAPAYWDIEELGKTVGLDLTALPGEYLDWRFSTEVFILHGGATYLLLSDHGLRHRVLSGDDVSLTFVQRLLPFVQARPDQLTGTMVFLVTVPGRLAALGGLRGYRRALIETGRACAHLAGAADADGEIVWEWDTEFYDDAAARILGVDGVERVVTHIGYQRVLSDDSDDLDEAPPHD
ncbi:MAG: hypothetical protein WAP35_08400 [Solirubrobacterales bacterium]